MNHREVVLPLVLALLGGLVCLAALPSDASNALVAVVSAGAGLAIFVLAAAAQRLLPRLLHRLMLRLLDFVFFALRAWAVSKRDALRSDSLISWATDQLLVAQQRYAVAVSCIAFGRDQHGDLRVLLYERKFERFPDRVLLWPGGRFRGHLPSVQLELEARIHEQTGCKVQLISPFASHVSFCEPVLTYSAAPDGDSHNQLFAPPLFVMQQNKPQSNSVPGHVDVVFLGMVEDGHHPKADGRWMSVTELQSGPPPDSRLWPDTRRCILRAAEHYDSVRPMTSDAPA